MQELKLFDYEKQKDTFFINRINHVLNTDYVEEDLYSKDTTYQILRKLTSKSFIRQNDELTELLGEFIVFIENKNQIKLS